MKHREFVMLAQTYNQEKHNLNGAWLSEKLDGMRALWLPSTRGMLSDDVPFCNRLRDNRSYMCTGLWSRYGKVIHCPSWFTKGLPLHPLDGELWIARKKFQQLMSTVKELNPSSGWHNVRYMMFDIPAYSSFYTEGQIRNPNYEYYFPGSRDHADEQLTFEHAVYALRRGFYGEHVQALPQFQMAYTKHEAESQLDSFLAGIVSEGGEGVMLRRGSSRWNPSRSHELVKVKPYYDSEARVEGWTIGEGKYTGVLGSLIVNWKGIRFNLSGMDDSQRWNYEKLFPIGTIVTFRYRELSVLGVPKEARFLRIRAD